MAVGLSIRFNGGTQEQYDAMHSEMNVDGNPPAGLILHAGGPIDSGWGIIDFWESRGQFDRFAEERIKPAMEALGDRGPASPPDIREFPVHHLLKP